MFEISDKDINDLAGFGLLLAAFGLIFGLGYLFGYFLAIGNVAGTVGFGIAVLVSLYIAFSTYREA